MNTKIEAPLAQLQRHARELDRAAGVVIGVHGVTPVDLCTAERALFEADQAIRRARRAIAAARSITQTVHSSRGLNESSNAR